MNKCADKPDNFKLVDPLPYIKGSVFWFRRNDYFSDERIVEKALVFLESFKLSESTSKSFETVNC